MSISRTICPKREKDVPVSTATRPVTQTAEVEVNRALNQPMLSPSWDAKGRDRSTAPIRISSRKPAASSRSGRSAREEKKDFGFSFIICKASSFAVNRGNMPFPILHKSPRPRNRGFAAESPMKTKAKFL